MTEILGYIATAFSLTNLMFALLGTVVGITVGALPGFTPTMGIAVLIPLTYTMNPTSALVFLGAIYCGSMFGGSISAILINTPGTSAAAATAMDGYAMTQKGRAHEALVEAASASFWGGVISVFALIFLAPPLARFAFQFGPQEKFMMALFGLTIIASLSTKDVIKGLMMGCVGLVIASIGMDPMLGKARFTFGSTFLMGGITMIPAVIGLFSVSQIFSTMKDPVHLSDKSMIAQFKSAKIHLKDLARYPVTYLRSAIIGIVVGIIPGTGGDVASYVSHNIGKMFSKEQLSGLTIQGLTPGYGLFSSEKEITYPFICALFIANVLMLLIGMFGAKHFAKVTLTPKNILSAFVLFLSMIGTYAVRGNLNDVVVMLVFGVLGYLLKLYKYNVVPIVLGLILGPIAETGLSQAMLLNNNSLGATLLSMLTRPICLVLLSLMIASIAVPFIMDGRKKAPAGNS